MKKFICPVITSLVLCYGVFFSCAAFADPDKPYDKAYANGAGRKLERGVSNLTLGWMEIPKEITIQGKRGGPGAACLWGPIQGAGNAIARTVLGAYETLTFPLPAPPEFKPMRGPEFVLDEEAQPSKARR